MLNNNNNQENLQQVTAKSSKYGLQSAFSVNAYEVMHYNFQFFCVGARNARALIIAKDEKY